MGLYLAHKPPLKSTANTGFYFIAPLETDVWKEAELSKAGDKQSGRALDFKLLLGFQGQARDWWFMGVVYIVVYIWVGG